MRGAKPSPAAASGPLAPIASAPPRQGGRASTWGSVTCGDSSSGHFSRAPLADASADEEALLEDRRDAAALSGGPMCLVLDAGGQLLALW